MHWIYVGIMLWIGLMIAPYVIGLIVTTIPFFIGGIIGLLVFSALTQEPAWGLIGFIVGGVFPYVIMNRD